MRLLRSTLLLFGLTLLAACATPQITDFSDRSVVYVWVDVEQARGNKVVGGSFRNFAPGDGGGVYPVGVEKLGDGFLVYHEGIAPGPTKLGTVDAMFCIGLCGNTINVYDFGNQGGDIAATTVRSRGVYDLGSYAIVSQRTGLFSPRVFDVQRTSGPSKRQILQTLLPLVGEDQRPVVQAALDRL
ncbi:hypothetical protein [Yoonia sp.]|uniref:hypothetical protein n=1 Tax=Yoonia sp. TaxID=2212373 RepID=UPI0023B5E9DF